MCVRQRVGQLATDPQHVSHGQSALPIQPIAEGAGLDVRHRVVEMAGCFARVEQRKDVRMLQVGRRADLAMKALGAEGETEPGMEQLEGDRSVVA